MKSNRQTVALNPENTKKLRRITGILNPKTAQQFSEWAVNSAVEAYCDSSGFPNGEFAQFVTESAGNLENQSEGRANKLITHQIMLPPKLKKFAEKRASDMGISLSRYMIMLSEASNKIAKN